MALISYHKQNGSNKSVTGTIPSGVQSGDTTAELLIKDPLEQHPQIKGMYRAYDPNTKWLGWAKYTPPTPASTPPVTPTPEEIYHTELAELVDKQKLVDLGVFTELELDLATLRASIKSKYDESYN